MSGPVRLADQVAAMLSEEIESGRLTEGDQLPTEVALVKQLGVSRTVVREALSRLRNAGLVEPRQGLGVFQDADDGFWTRTEDVTVDLDTGP